MKKYKDWILSNIQYLLAISILVIGISYFEYTRDFVSGRLEYLWNFAEITNKDLRTFTILIIIGAGAATLIDQIWLKRKNLTAETKRGFSKFLKFGMVGGFGLIWKTILLAITVEIFNFSEYFIIYPIFIIIALHNYLGNKYITFRHVESNGSNKVSFLNYVLINLGTLALYSMAYYILLYLNIHYLIASILAVGVGAVFNFVLIKQHIWKF